MPRKLQKLRIDEVSAVDRAANQHARVAFLKRDPAAVFRKIFGAETLRDVLDKAAANPALPRFKQDDSEDEDRLRDEEDAAAREEEEEEADEDARRSAFDDGAGGDNFDKDHHASRVADLLVEAAEGRISRPAALRWLLHHKDGAAVLHRLRTQKREVIPMTREQELSSIAKKFGVAAVCKKIVDDGPGGISEHEMTKLITEAAQRAYPELRPAVAFAKMFCGDDGVLLRKAVGACRTFATQPAHKQAVSSSGTAFSELEAKATELRKREPGLTPAQSLAKVYSDPANVELARRERAENRPHT